MFSRVLPGIVLFSPSRQGRNEMKAPLFHHCNQRSDAIIEENATETKENNVKERVYNKHLNIPFC